MHAGWLNVLFPLKAWLLQGLDWRNDDPTRTWIMATPISDRESDFAGPR